MRCELIEPHLAAYLDGELDESLHAAVERHLKDCPSCGEAVRGMRLACAILGKWRPAEPTESLVWALRERIEREGATPLDGEVGVFRPGAGQARKARPRSRTAGRRLALTAAVLLALGAGFAGWTWVAEYWGQSATRTVARLGRTTMSARTVGDLRRAEMALDPVIAEQWTASRPNVRSLVELEVVATMMHTATRAEQGRHVGRILDLLGKRGIAVRVGEGVEQFAGGARDCVAALFAMRRAAADERREVEKLLDEAMKLDERGEQEAALGKYRRVAAGRLLALRSLIHQANLQMRLGRADEAVATLGEAYTQTRSRTFNREIVTELKRRAERAAELQKKIDALETELVKTEDAFDVLSSMGNLQVKAGNLKGAKETFEGILRAHAEGGPGRKRACLRIRLLKAWCRREMNQHGPACEEFDRLVDDAGKVYPEVAMLAQFERAKTLQLQGRHAQAIDDYTDLANTPNISPGCYAALEFQVGYIYLLDLGNTAQALKTFAPLKREPYRSEVFGRLAEAVVAGLAE